MKVIETTGRICSINGPVVKVKGSMNFKMLDMIYVGSNKLIGEVIAIESDVVIIQVYESTDGLNLNDTVVSAQKPMFVTLGPGIIGNIFDGIQRPLNDFFSKSGIFLDAKTNLSSLDTDKKYKIELNTTVGQYVLPGQIIAEFMETSIIKHKVLIPPNVEGEIVEMVESGEYTIKDTILKVKKLNNKIVDIRICQEWAIRKPRPYSERFLNVQPLITGQRVIDTMFPLAKGGMAAIPGGFGTGKTMTQHQLAKWSDADIIVYIGCGERGNEMTQVLEEFTGLIDPKSGKSLMERTVLIANTSNMPVAAREASIYTGITIAEYYRDMGYHVAIMADSTSRWAEALREISGRLEEMPAEEGYPAYLPSRLAGFYERAGYVRTLSQNEGSITIIGAVSPQGGDFSEPVTQNTKRFVKSFLALDRQLAYSRHYPAINWLNSYSGYVDELASWYRDEVNENFLDMRTRLMSILQEESTLMEVVKLIGSDVLPEDQKLTLEIAKIIRIAFLQQNAYHENDTYVPIKRQFSMMDAILYMADKTKKILELDVPMSVIQKYDIFEDILKMKYDSGEEDELYFSNLKRKVNLMFDSIQQEYKAK